MKHYISRLLTIILVTMATISAQAYDFEVNGIYYNITEGSFCEVTYRSTSYNSYSGNVVIPSTVINGKPYIVRGIGSNAFRGCSNLSSITIPNTVTSIGEDAFLGCSNLPVVDNIRYADTYAIECIRNYSQPITSYTLKAGTRFIGNRAFYDCSELTSITIPSSVTSIGKEAFYGCRGLTSITIPSSVTSIGKEAFYGCRSLSDITIPNSVTSIGYGVFGGCESLSDITIPNSVTSIGDYAFDGCTSLSDITIPNSVTSIGIYAFYGCTSLSDITIPNSVTSIDMGAFSGCTNLHRITLNTLQFEGIETFSYVKEIIIGDEVELIPQSAFSCLYNLQSVTIGKKITSMGSFAFERCTSLTDITIPNSVTSIGSSAFYLCTSLTDITIPNSVTSIGNRAFEDCTSLSDITIPNSVTSIGYSAFEGCTSLSDITIPNSVTEISPSAFNGCTSLSDITIPNSVTNISYGAFEGCTSLSDITIPNSVTEIGASAFNGCTSLSDITIPNSVTLIREKAFYGCMSLTNVTIGNGVKDIYPYAFANCPELNMVELDVADGSKISIGLSIVSPKTPKPTLRIPADAINYIDNQIWTNDFHIEPVALNLIEKEPYIWKEDILSTNVTYKRTFTRNSWQALYLPFEVPYEEWSEYGQAAGLKAVHQYYGNADNTTIIVEVRKLKEGDSLKPNTPYVFSVNNEWLNEETIWGGENREVKAVANGQVWCASSRNRFTFTGVYEKTSFEGKYAIGNGDFVLGGPTAYVDPYRIILSIENEDHGYGTTSDSSTISEVRPAFIDIMVEEESTTTDIEGIAAVTHTTFYDLQGRCVSKQNMGGIYVINGKKVIY